MKTKLIILAALVTSLSMAVAGHIKAPNGGRVIHTTKPNAEFLVAANQKIEIRFLDDAGKVIAPAGQVVTVTMGDRTKPTKLAFAAEGDKLVSDKAIPEGKELPVVLQIKAKEGEKAVTEKFNLNMAPCPECKLPEYACACDHEKKVAPKPHAHADGKVHEH